MAISTLFNLLTTPKKKKFRSSFGASSASTATLWNLFSLPKHTADNQVSTLVVDIMISQALLYRTGKRYILKE